MPKCLVPQFQVCDVFSLFSKCVPVIHLSFLREDWDPGTDPEDTTMHRTLF